MVWLKGNVFDLYREQFTDTENTGKPQQAYQQKTHVYEILRGRVQRVRVVKDMEGERLFLSRLPGGGQQAFSSGERHFDEGVISGRIKTGVHVTPSDTRRFGGDPMSAQK